MQGAAGRSYAGMFGVQISGDLGMDKQDLVLQIKFWERKSEAHKQSWYSFCSQQLNTQIYDPGRHEVKNLQLFVGAVETGEIVVDSSSFVEAVPAPPPGPPPPSALMHANGFAGTAPGTMMPSGGCGGVGDPEVEKEKALLIEKVKSFQRQGEMYKDAWYTFVHQQGTSNYDPRRHDNAALKYFLNLADTGQIDFSASAPPPSGKGKGGKGMQPQEENVLPGQRPGDWQCSSCQGVNYSYRSTCTSCKAPSKGAQRVGLKPGDWICTGCGDLVFSSKPMCKMCGTPKPADVLAAQGTTVAPGQLGQVQPQLQQSAGQQQQPVGALPVDASAQQGGALPVDASAQQGGALPVDAFAQQGTVAVESARVSPY